jgi:hypothetical protein
MRALTRVLTAGFGLLLLLCPASARANEPLPSDQHLPPQPSEANIPAVRLLAQASLTAYDESSWLGAGLAIEGRVAGAVWFIGGASFETRPEVQATTSAGRFTVPLQLGFRRVAFLPGRLELRGGGDFLLVFEAALPAGEEERVLAPRPGGLLEIGLTLPLGRRLNFDLALRMGAVFREHPSEIPGLPPLSGPDPRFQLRMGLRLNLDPNRP